MKPVQLDSGKCAKKIIEKFQADDFLTSATERDYLGRGSFASVRICSHPTLGDVVVKCFQIIGSKEAATKIKNEVEAEANELVKLQHENIIRCYGITKWSNYYGLVMEKGLRYNMEDLLIYNTNQSISWPVRLKFSLDIAQGLEYLHYHDPKQAYIHGDLKPQNILFDENVVAKIADFGALSITNASASVEPQFSSQYTELYSAPELLNNPFGDRTVSMDVYSYAMIVYEIITRRQVFSGTAKVPIRLIQQLIIEKEQKPDLSYVDEACKSLTCDENREIFELLGKVMVECWAYNPKDRRSMKSVKLLLEDFTINEPCHIKHLKENHKHNEADDKVPLSKFEHPFKAFVQEPRLSPSGTATEKLSNSTSQSQNPRASQQSSTSPEKHASTKLKCKTSTNQEDKSERSTKSDRENISNPTSKAVQKVKEKLQQLAEHVRNETLDLQTCLSEVTDSSNVVQIQNLNVFVNQGSETPQQIAENLRKEVLALQTGSKTPQQIAENLGKEILARQTGSFEDNEKEAILNSNSQFEQTQASHQAFTSSEKLSFANPKHKTPINQQDRSEISTESVGENISDSSTKVAGQDAKLDKAEPQPYSSMHRANLDMIETEEYKANLEKVRDMQKAILFFYGLPGSGKSLIVQNLAEKFPFSRRNNQPEAPLALKFYINCKNRRNSFKEELIKITEILLTHNHIEEKYVESLKENLERDSAESFVDRLLSIKSPVLIVIENPELVQNKILIHDLIRKLLTNCELNHGEPKVHLYITSRKESSLLYRGETRNNPIYIKTLVKGLSPEDGLEYLKQDDRKDDDLKDRKEVYEQLRGLPLGLTVTKLFCINHSFSYAKYLQYLEKHPYEIIQSQKKEIEKNFGPSAQHLFQAIVYSINESDENIDSLRTKVLSCISYLHFDCVPRSVFEYCCEFVRELSQIFDVKTSFESIDFAGELIKSLLDRDMCTVNDKSELAFNDVVMAAFRSNELVQQETFKASFNSKQMAISILKRLKTQLLLSEDLLKIHFETLQKHLDKKYALFKFNSLAHDQPKKDLPESASSSKITPGPRSYHKNQQDRSEISTECFEENISDSSTKVAGQGDEERKRFKEEFKRIARQASTDLNTYLMKEASKKEKILQPKYIDCSIKNIEVELSSSWPDLGYNEGFSYPEGNISVNELLAMNKKNDETADKNFITILGSSGSGKTAIVKTLLQTYLREKSLHGAEYLFHIDFSDLDLKKKTNLLKLLACNLPHHWVLNDIAAEVVLEDVKDKTLIVIDGFRAADIDWSNNCSANQKPEDEETAENHIINLLTRKSLPEASLLVTMRPSQLFLYPTVSNSILVLIYGLNKQNQIQLSETAFSGNSENIILYIESYHPLKNFCFMPENCLSVMYILDHLIKEEKVSNPLLAFPLTRIFISSLVLIFWKRGLKKSKCNFSCIAKFAWTKYSETLDFKESLNVTAHCCEIVDVFLQISPPKKLFTTYDVCLYKICFDFGIAVHLLFLELDNHALQKCLGLWLEKLILGKKCHYKNVIKFLFGLSNISIHNILKEILPLNKLNDRTDTLLDVFSKTLQSLEIEQKQAFSTLLCFSSLAFEMQRADFNKQLADSIFPNEILVDKICSPTEIIAFLYVLKSRHNKLIVRNTWLFTGLTQKIFLEEKEAFLKSQYNIIFS